MAVDPISFTKLLKKTDDLCCSDDLLLIKAIRWLAFDRKSDDLLSIKLLFRWLALNTE